MNGRGIFYRTCIVIITLAVAYGIYQLMDLLVVLVFAIVFASTIRPLVGWLVQRGVHHAGAILLVYLIVLTGIIGLLLISIPPLVALTIELFSEGGIIETVRSVSLNLAIFGWDRFRVMLPVFTLPEHVQAWVNQAGDEARRLAWPFAQGTLLVLSQFILVFLIAFYWLTSRERILKLLLQLSPSRSRWRVETVWDDVEHTLGAWVRGQAVLMIVIGVASLIGLVALGVPYAVALAVIAGLTEAIPMVGPFLGAIPAVIIGFTVSPLTGLLVAAWFLIIQLIEGYVLLPRVMSNRVGLNPLLVVLALVGGGILGGIAGALLAVPLAGALQVSARRLWIDPTIQNNSVQHIGKGVVIFDPHESPPATAAALDGIVEAERRPR